MFEIGKKYTHTSGRTITVITGAYTNIHGWCLIAEDSKGELIPIGNHEGAFANWHCTSHTSDNSKADEKLAENT